ncbi:glycosyltransferase family 2 protein [Mucilaginibacter sp. HD30]
MVKKGLLTIGVPTYNGGHNLTQLLESVANLGLPAEAYEVLIVDNGSTDDTAKVIEMLKSNYINIVYHKNESNVGRIENWNRVLDLAGGEYLILMNVNDRFLKFKVAECLQYLKNNPGAALVMNDVMCGDYQHPNWQEEAVLELSDYINKTFIDIDYLEFNSLGVLQQHIFRTQVLIDNGIRFDPQLPRTTDRVFIAQAIKHGGGKFYYTGQPVVSWQLNSNRYHNQVHNETTAANIDQLWGNEYRANVAVASLANIPYLKVLESQLIFAAFMRLAKLFRAVKYRFTRQAAPDKSREIATSDLYYRHLSNMAKANNAPVNYLIINLRALKRAAVWQLASSNLYRKKPRTISDIKAQQLTMITA